MAGISATEVCCCPIGRGINIELAVGGGSHELGREGTQGEFRHFLRSTQC